MVPLPDDSAPGAAPDESASEKVCPNCGVPVPPNATACAECGISLLPKEAPARKKSLLPKALQPLGEAWQKLREHKAFPHHRGRRRRGPDPDRDGRGRHRHPKVRRSPRPLRSRSCGRSRGRRRRPRARKSPSRRRRCSSTGRASATRRLVARDRILKIGQELAAYADKNHQPPATLAEAGAAEADSADYTYVGPEIAALPALPRQCIRDKTVGVLRSLRALQRRQRAAGPRRADLRRSC